MRLRALPWLWIPLVAGCAAGPIARPSESVVSPPPRQTPTRAHDPASASFRENLARAEREAESAGWVLREVIEIPKRNAALVLYQPKPERAPATKLTRVDAVGAGSFQVMTAQSGLVDVMKAPGGELVWNLRGDGSTNVVLHLTPCGANCGVAKPLVLELTAQGFAPPPGAPECPTCIHDENRDGVPEFDLRLAALRVAPCSRVSCGPEAALIAEVRGLESWNGQAFARDLPVLEPLYFERLKRVKREAEKVRSGTSKSKVCPLHALQVAAQLFAYSRLTGDSEQDALASADDVMRGYDTGPCSKEYDLLGPPRSWRELREEVRGMRLPELQRGRSQ